MEHIFECKESKEEIESDKVEWIEMWWSKTNVKEKKKHIINSINTLQGELKIELCKYIL